MDTWNVKACLLGRADWSARLRDPRTGVPSFRALQWEPGCPPSERCNGNRGAPLKSDARTRACRGSVWKRGHHCLLVADRSAYARRVRDEALTNLLNWNADICCCSLRRDHFKAERGLLGGPPISAPRRGSHEPAQLECRILLLKPPKGSSGA